jgi:hypothetical protein
MYSTQEFESNTRDNWVIDATVNNTSVRFRIDTGAKTSILTSAQIATIPGCKLQKSSKTLKSFSNHRITPDGSIKLPVTYRDKTTDVHFEVVSLDQENILGGDTAVALGLIQITLDSQISVVAEITENAEEELSRDFPELVKTTGTLPGEYSLSIDSSVQGVIHPVRKLPAAIKPKAIEKLKEMVENGYITPVEQPTD